MDPFVILLLAGGGLLALRASKAQAASGTAAGDPNLSTALGAEPSSPGAAVAGLLQGDIDVDSIINALGNIVGSISDQKKLSRARTARDFVTRVTAGNFDEDILNRKSNSEIIRLRAGGVRSFAGAITIEADTRPTQEGDPWVQDMWDAAQARREVLGGPFSSKPDPDPIPPSAESIAAVLALTPQPGVVYKLDPATGEIVEVRP